MSFKKNKVAILHKAFPTYILQIEDFISEQECKNVLQKIKENKKLLKKHKSFLGNATTSYKENNFLDKLDSSIKSSLLEATKKYSELSGFKTYNELRGSWFNVQKKQSSLQKHSHPLSTVSGVLYIKCKKGSFNTYFFNPNPMLDFTDKSKNTELTSEWFSFTPKDRTLLIFPSWLQHGSNFTKNKSNERIVLSFNII